MRLDTVLNWTTLLLPLSSALSITSHLSTETTLQCSTVYSTSSPSVPFSTTTLPLPQTTEISPVILHNYTTSTTTITPKPFETLFSILATKTKTVEREAVNGTLGVEVTKFRTSTFWHHETTTRTVTKERLLTTRTTVWVGTPTGFVGVRDAGSASQATLNTQTTLGSSGHVRRVEDSTITSSKKAVLQKPTKGRFAVAVSCVQHGRVHTTETLLLTASKLATVTAKQETRYTNRTIYGTITSTILANSSTSTSAASETLLASSTTPSSSTYLSSKRQAEQALSSPTPAISTTPSLSSSILNDVQSIVTNTTTVTKTPYTITFTWTSTATATSTATLHATTTITSYAACATSNLLSQTSKNRRINGVSLPEDLGVEDVAMESLETQTAALCCEQCIKRKGCLWSIWEASGEKKGACYLSLLFNNTLANDSEGKKSTDSEAQKEAKGEEGVAMEKQASVCDRQEQEATFGFSGKNGEVRYVVSNGLCGVLVEQ